MFVNWARGSFGEVWLAIDLNLKRHVAVKRIKDGVLDSRETSTLRSEAELVAQLEHPNLVSVFAWRQPPMSDSKFKDDDFLFLQYVDGGSISDRLKNEGRLNWDIACRYVADVAGALKLVHETGIVHRDIKPGNILYDAAKDEALLTDFGVSARLGASAGLSGTLPYIPPEVLCHFSRGQSNIEYELNPSFDIYSLGVTLFQMIVGELPFTGKTVSEVMEASSQGLASNDPRLKCIPFSVESLIRHSLSIDPSDRPNAETFSAHLRGHLNQGLVQSLRFPYSEPSRRQSTLSNQIESDRLLKVRVEKRTLAGYVPVEAKVKTAQLLRDLKRVPHPGVESILQTGDQIKICIQSSDSGFVGVFNIGPTGNLSIIEPSSENGEPIHVNAGEILEIEGIELTQPSGKEQLSVIWAGAPSYTAEFIRILTGESSGYEASRTLQNAAQAIARKRKLWRIATLDLNHE